MSESKTYDYLTPPEVIKAYLKHLRKVSENPVIDLDVASNNVANSYVRANRYYESDGLKQPWHGDNNLIFPPTGVSLYRPAALKRDLFFEHQSFRSSRIPNSRLWFRKAYTAWVTDQYTRCLFIFVGSSSNFVSILKDPVSKKWGMPTYLICDNNKLSWYTDEINKNSGDFNKIKSPELCVLFYFSAHYVHNDSDIFCDCFEHLGKIMN